VLNYFRNRDTAEATAEEIRALGRQVHVVRADIGDPEDLERLVDSAAEELGGLDILVHNAASGYNRPVMEQRVKGWDWTLNINARAALFLAQRAAPVMAARGGGAMVNISSVGSQRVLPEYVVVGASKAALEAVTRYLAVELAPMKIVVNAVSAGMVKTDALQHFPNMRERFEEIYAQALERTPAGQMLTSEDVAGVVAFLCSPEAFMIRGQTILIDGGTTLGF
jgi:enoyl-[acyl-carrier protein] reductase III